MDDLEEIRKKLQKMGFGIHSLYSETLPEPYCSIADLPFDPHGWFENEKALAECFSSKKIHTVIEVGSWLGLSTRFLAEHALEKVYAIDTWAGSHNEPWHLKDPRLPHLYQLFLSNIKYAGYAGKVIPFRARSLEAAKALTVTADLIYIDAAHDETSVHNDIHAWFPHLNEGAIMCGDDYSWPTVKKAVDKAAFDLYQEVITNGKFWRFERKK